MPRLVAALVAVLLLTACAQGDERVDVTAMDGEQLIAELGGVSGPGVVLVHGVQGDRRRWQAVAAVLAARGFRPLRVDLRGHGESGGTVDLMAADRDVEGAYRYLLGRKIRPVFVVGEGAGGSAALVVATRVPATGVAVLGPLPAAGAPDARTAASALRVPVLFVVAEADRETRAFASIVPDARLVTVDGNDPLASPRTGAAILELLGAGGGK